MGVPDARVLELARPSLAKLDVVQIGRRDGSIEAGDVGHQPSHDAGERGQSGEGGIELHHMVSDGFLSSGDKANLHAGGSRVLFSGLRDLMCLRQ